MFQTVSNKWFFDSWFLNVFSFVWNIYKVFTIPSLAFWYLKPLQALREGTTSANRSKMIMFIAHIPFTMPRCFMVLYSCISDAKYENMKMWKIFVSGNGVRAVVLGPYAILEQWTMYRWYCTSSTFQYTLVLFRVSIGMPYVPFQILQSLSLFCYYLFAQLHRCTHWVVCCLVTTKK